MYNRLSSLNRTSIVFERTTPITNHGELWSFIYYLFFCVIVGYIGESLQYSYALSDFSVQRMCVKYCEFSFLVASMSVNWELQCVCYLLKWRENKHEKCFRCHGTVPIIIISSGEIRVKQFPHCKQCHLSKDKIEHFKCGDCTQN